MIGGHERMIIFDGVLQPWQHIDTPYVYQNIHTLGYRPYNLPAHIAALNIAAKELFKLHLEASAQDIENQINSLLSSQRLSFNVSICVIIKLYATGEYSLENLEPSIYRGYALRGLRMEACFMNQRPDVSGHPSSTTLAARRMADAMAKRDNLNTAIMLDSDDSVVFEPTLPLFCTIDDAVILPQNATTSVELDMVEKAAHRCGLKIYRRYITRDMVESADEVLIASWQGITSISCIDDEFEYHWTIIAERIAEGMKEE